MKKILILLSTMTLLLSACGSETPVDETPDPDVVATVAAEMMAATVAAQEADAAAQAAVVPTEVPTEVIPTPALSTDFENAAPIQTQLLIGIYQLENTAQAITKDQANFLYAQFLALQTSMTNQTLTEEEMGSLTLQQEAILSAEQIQAINALQITQESVMTTMQQLGIEAQGRDGGGGEASDATGAGGGQRGSGGAGGEGGAPPTDGSAPPQQGGGGVQNGTAPEEGERNNNFVPPELIDAIITLLENKINS